MQDFPFDWRSAIRAIFHNVPGIARQIPTYRSSGIKGRKKEVNSWHLSNLAMANMMQRMPCTLSFKGFIEKHGNHIQITWDLGWMLICHNFQQAKRAQVPQRQCFCSSNKPDQSLQSMMLAGMNMFGKLIATRDGMNFEPVSHRNLWQDLGTRLRRWHPTTVPTQPRISSQLTHSLSLPMDHCCWFQ